MTLETKLTSSKINSLFSKAGWASRMCSWTEHEITSEFAELVIASEAPVLITGGIDRALESVDKLLSILDNAGVSFRFDVYDEIDCLLRSKPSN